MAKHSPRSGTPMNRNWPIPRWNGEMGEISWTDTVSLFPERSAAGNKGRRTKEGEEKQQQRVVVRRSAMMLHITTIDNGEEKSGDRSIDNTDCACCVVDNRSISLGGRKGENMKPLPTVTSSLCAQRTY